MELTRWFLIGLNNYIHRGIFYLFWFGKTIYYTKNKQTDLYIAFIFQVEFSYFHSSVFFFRLYIFFLCFLLFSFRMGYKLLSYLRSCYVFNDWIEGKINYLWNEMKDGFYFVHKNFDWQKVNVILCWFLLQLIEIAYYIIFNMTSL